MTCSIGNPRPAYRDSGVRGSGVKASLNKIPFALSLSKGRSSF